MNLIEDCWIPVLRENGLKELIAPWQLTDKFGTNPIVALAAPRPDFQGGLMQFLIGLLQTVTPPEEDGEIEWEDWLEEPPTPETLRQSFEPYIDCFNLDGDGPRFMQDLELNGADTVEIGTLLIDTPGENTVKRNTDHFVKRGGAQKLCYSCTATALYTLQISAPSGGSGHRTSIRGGGPLTTLLKIDPEGSGVNQDFLWHNVWLNVLDKSIISDRGNRPIEKKSVFLWLAPTRTSEKTTGCATHAENVHPVHMYWCIPRRFRLEFGQVGEGVCDICNSRNTKVVTEVQQKALGVNYEGVWRHPLSPHWIDEQGEPSPLHPQPGGFTYRHWSNWVESTNTHQPATVVRDFKSRMQKTEQLRIWAFGYDMDNAKPRNYYDSTFPLFLFDKKEVSNVFSIRLQEHIEASTMVAGFVSSCVKNAKKNLRKSLIEESCFTRTEDSFFQSMSLLGKELKDGKDGKETLASWYNVLVKEGITLFEEYAERDDAALVDMKQVALARKKLKEQLYGKKLKAVLHLPTGKRG
jgi:CRISPR system Cascade subunit CasA